MISIGQKYYITPPETGQSERLFGFIFNSYFNSFNLVKNG